MSPIEEGFEAGLDADSDEPTPLDLVATPLSCGKDESDRLDFKPTLEDLMLRICREYGLPDGALSNRRRTQPLAEARGALAWLAKELKIATITEVANHLNRDPSTLSFAARRFAERGESCPEMIQRLKKLVDET